MPELYCVILGGPNGSGKSSAFAKLKLEGIWINADEIARALPESDDGKSKERRASEIALRQIADMIESRKSFVFETTLSSQQSIRLMREAKAAGFKIGLYYVALDSVETNVERVKQRVLKGGHDIPEADIRRRHKGSLEKLTEALKLSDEVVLMDNSGLTPHEVFTIRSGVVQSFDIDDRQELHRLFSAKVCEAYGLVRYDRGFRKLPKLAARRSDEVASDIPSPSPGHRPKPPGMR
ncbi:AAA family ATPase [Rhizobium laguerreae]|uniref:zeta toxin family protein n=1 Tax=Rhizobium laguerreae TaxID=1076926 RepID=UPI001441B529|nr:zeta toxin family protein [Rhizobium laguerreae]MBY3141831.1 AAA family ATPase [Rhizobium laguerreae]MBY3164670.1 AAA family ATPase [Rhizobium laguerreae]MBY3205167.1 AAA family ATPase [Rhizobium laguerreae]MBY3266695.1 AAA family ATPase [Rhizobium laguerreae]MBY3341948.1 AAA family ATPase [Rhizobium laguerreae]